jgi:hypothetical protein
VKWGAPREDIQNARGIIGYGQGYSIGSLELGSAWEVSGAGSAFGVTTLSADESGGGVGVELRFVREIVWPDGRREVEGVWGKHFAKSELNALLFSMASLVKYETNPPSPPTAAPAARTASLRARVVRLSVPLGFPAGLPDMPG